MSVYTLFVIGNTSISLFLHALYACPFPCKTIHIHSYIFMLAKHTVLPNNPSIVHVCVFTPIHVISFDGYNNWTRINKFHFWSGTIKFFTPFQVEYKDSLSGQTLVAFAEAPNEALPLYCRPNFGVAWLTQYKFKVGVWTWGLKSQPIYISNISVILNDVS